MFSIMENRAVDNIPDMFRSLQMVATSIWHLSLIRDLSEEAIEAFDYLTGFVCVADDLIIHRKTLEDHDEYLDAFVGR